jgi:succinate dehydrogenase hydrophobic anchor subunit
MKKEKKAILYNIIIPGKGDRYVNKSKSSNILFSFGIISTLAGLLLIVYLLYHYYVGEERFGMLYSYNDSVKKEFMLYLLLIVGFLIITRIIFAMEIKYRFKNIIQNNEPIIRHTYGNNSGLSKTIIRILTAVLGVFAIIVLIIIFTNNTNKQNEDKSTSNQTNTQPTIGVKKQNEEALYTTLRDFGNAFRSCIPSNCASYYKEAQQRDNYKRKLSNMFNNYGCPQNSEMSDIKIISINETSAEVTFKWVWLCNFEKDSRFYRRGTYAGPFTKGNCLMQAKFEKGSTGWQLTDMKTLQKGKDDRSWSLDEWRSMIN